MSEWEGKVQSTPPNLNESTFVQKSAIPGSVLDVLDPR
jgi:hypothetical protein